MSSPSSVFQVVFQNENFLIINKDNNLSTQRNNNYDSSVEEQLMLCGFPFSLLPRCGIVHRLDKDTTGLLIVAKNKGIFSLFEKLFKERKIRKTYLSLHRGVPESSSGEVSFYQGKTFTKGGVVRMKTNPFVGKLVNITFQLVEVRNGFSLLEVFPFTGRTHQIRLAFQKIKLPIYNDPIYNTEEPVNTHGQYLHAWKLSFNLGKELFEFRAEIPTFFQQELDKLQITIL